MLRALTLSTLLLGGLALAGCGPTSDDPSYGHSGATAQSHNSGGSGGSKADDGDPIDPGGASGETCGNGFDDDGNGKIDDGCPCSAATQSCYPGDPSQVGKGKCKAGTQSCQKTGEVSSAWGPCEGAVLPDATETCNGVDDDCDGVVDPGCQCTAGQTQPCGSDVGACQPGIIECKADGTWSECTGAIEPSAEVCGNNIDENCDGVADEGCATTVTVDLNINGDCVTASCPPEAPYPVGCNVTFQGGDGRGCIANAPGSSVVYFQEGDVCSAGHVSGTLSCSSEPGGGLNESNCPMNKSEKYYPTSKSGCPDT
jgi:hypothetical protein